MSDVELSVTGGNMSRKQYTCTGFIIPGISEEALEESPDVRCWGCSHYVPGIYDLFKDVTDDKGYLETVECFERTVSLFHSIGGVGMLPILMTSASTEVSNHSQFLDTVMEYIKGGDLPIDLLRGVSKIHEYQDVYTDMVYRETRQTLKSHARYTDHYIHYVSPQMIDTNLVSREDGLMTMILIMLTVWGNLPGLWY